MAARPAALVSTGIGGRPRSARRRRISSARSISTLSRSWRFLSSCFIFARYSAVCSGGSLPRERASCSSDRCRSSSTCLSRPCRRSCARCIFSWSCASSISLRTRGGPPSGPPRGTLVARFAGESSESDDDDDDAPDELLGLSLMEEEEGEGEDESGPRRSGGIATSEEDDAGGIPAMRYPAERARASGRDRGRRRAFRGLRALFFKSR